MGSHRASFQLLLAVASPGKSWDQGVPRSGGLLENGRQELGVDALLYLSCPCSEHPSPSYGSRLRHLHKEGSMGKVLASEGSHGAGTLGKAGGKLKNRHGNYATRRGFVAS